MDNYKFPPKEWVSVIEQSRTITDEQVVDEIVSEYQERMQTRVVGGRIEGRQLIVESSDLQRLISSRSRLKEEVEEKTKLIDQLIQALKNIQIYAADHDDEWVTERIDKVIFQNISQILRNNARLKITQ